MSNDGYRLGDLFKAVNSVYLQSADLVRDTIRHLREQHDLYFVHEYSWDYTVKPNDHLLNYDCNLATRAYLTYRDASDETRGIGFCFDFCKLSTPVTPALLYGTIDLGTKTFTDSDRWPFYYTIKDTEAGELTTQRDGALTRVTGNSAKHVSQGVFCKVALEILASSDELQRIVVNPLAAMHNRELDKAHTLLSETPTFPWPHDRAHVEEDDDDEDPESI